MREQHIISKGVCGSLEACLLNPRLSFGDPSERRLVLKALADLSN